MSDTETAPASKQFVAVLTTGQRYHAFGITFERGVDSAPIDEKTKAYLEDECGYEATVDGPDGPEPEYRSRFQFREAGAPKAAARAPRQRRTQAD